MSIWFGGEIVQRFVFFQMMKWHNGESIFSGINADVAKS